MGELLVQLTEWEHYLNKIGSPIPSFACAKDKDENNGVHKCIYILKRKEEYKTGPY